MEGGGGWDKARYSPLCLGGDVHAFGAMARFRGGASSHRDVSDVSDTLTQLRAAEAGFYLRRCVLSPHLYVWGGGVV